MTTPQQPSANAADAITLRALEVFRTVRRHWIFVTATTIVVTALAALVSFSQPRTYKSEAVMLPETSSSSPGVSGNLSSLASLAGVKMGGDSQDAISPEFYPKVVGSTVFLAEVLTDKVDCRRLKGKVSVYDYLSHRQKHAWYNLPKEMKDDEKAGDNERINPKRLTKAQQRVMNSLKSALFCTVDKKTDIISIEVETQDAEVAQQIADLICNRLQTYITNYRTNKARKDVEHSKKIAAEAHTKYVKAQQTYAAYCDSHEDLALASYQQVSDRLENEMQLAFNVYSQYAQQLELAQVKLQERTPVYTTIQPATVPLKPSGPKRMFTVAAAFCLSFFGSIVGLLAAGSVRRAKRQMAERAEAGI